MSYTQLTQDERYQIHTARRLGHQVPAIAQVLGRHKSTIYRELKRNRCSNGYGPWYAHRQAVARRQGKARTRMDSATWQEVRRLLKLDWSPEQISRRLYCEQAVCISHEWIYRYVYRDQRAGGHLHRHLRCQKPRRKRYGVYERRGRMPNIRRIEQRPAIVEARTRLGDWESDTVIGHRQTGALVTVVDRRSRYTEVAHVARRTKAEVAAAKVACLAPHTGKLFTLTEDNGKEHADHLKLEQALGLRVYFARPYAPWQRGTNENTNGLLRQYFPKHRRLDHVDPAELERAKDRLNHRPRKVLDWKTPFEVFFNRLTVLTVALTS